jgi:hypothetical protein
MPTPEARARGVASVSGSSAQSAQSATRKRRLRRTGFVATAALAALLIGPPLWRFLSPALVDERCSVRQASGLPVEFGSDQMAGAATISAIAVRRGIPERAAVIAVATALQESKLRNLEGGDRDSLGLFQQRPSQGWGTKAQILDPVFATQSFYTHLVKVRGWQTLPLTKAAQAVQRSAFPDAYARHEPVATELAKGLTGAAPATITCLLEAPTTSRPAADVASDLRTQLGVTARSDGARVIVSAQTQALAWAAGAWGVAHADEAGALSVTVHDQAWVRSAGDDALTWSPAANAADPQQVVIVLTR